MRFLSVVAAAALATMSVPAVAETFTSSTTTTYYFDRPSGLEDHIIFSPGFGPFTELLASAFPVDGNWGAQYSIWSTYTFTLDNGVEGGDSGGFFAFFGPVDAHVTGHGFNDRQVIINLTFYPPAHKVTVFETTTLDFNCYNIECGANQPSSHFVEPYFYNFLGRDPIVTTLVAPVPEPSTWAMLILGFAGIAFMARRKVAAYSVC